MKLPSSPPEIDHFPMLTEHPPPSANSVPQTLNPFEPWAAELVQGWLHFCVSCFRPDTLQFSCETILSFLSPTPLALLPIASSLIVSFGRNGNFLNASNSLCFPAISERHLVSQSLESSSGFSGLDIRDSVLPPSSAPDLIAFSDLDKFFPLPQSGFHFRSLFLNGPFCLGQVAKLWRRLLLLKHICTTLKVHRKWIYCWCGPL